MCLHIRMVHTWPAHAMVLGWILVPFYHMGPRDQAHQTWQPALLEELNHLSTPHCVLKIYFFLFYVHECLSTCMIVYRVHTSCPWRSENGTRCLGTRATDVCKLLCGSWEPKSGPLQGQVLLAAEPPLQTPL